ncbi:hemerythrin domain-containing protein [Kribbella sp. NPDC004875]|uniref:hemerythrin domain-containing protein n=1 Tax=Kribbella sp. NPDC004875 TaxID=3364107 RepID=UPI0036D0FF08
MLDQSEGLRLYDELIAVHTIMRRSTALVVDALQALIDGRPARVATLTGLITWQSAFIHHHHESEDELFWPVLRTRFPDIVTQLDALSVDHDKLDRALERLLDQAASLRDAAAGETTARAVALLPAAIEVRDVLAGHLNTEEPVLKGLFPDLSAEEIVALRKAVVAGAPKSGPEWVLGLMVDPSQAQGYDIMMANFPPPVRWLRPVLMRRYTKARRSLAVA